MRHEIQAMKKGKRHYMTSSTIHPFFLRKELGFALLHLTGTNQSLNLLSVHVLHSTGILASSGKMLSQRGKLLSLNLALDEVDIGQDRVNLSGRRLATVSKIVDILDRALENTLVLLGGVLSGFLGLLGLFTVSLGCLFGVLLALLLLQTSLLLFFDQTLGLSLLVETLLVLASTGLLAELLDPLVLGRTVVEELPQTGDVFGLALAARIGVLLFDVTLLVTVFIVIRDVLIEVFKRSPAVKVVPEVVEVLEFLLGGVVIAKQRHGLNLGEASLRLEDRAPQLEEVTLGSLLLRRGLNIGGFINRVELAATDRVLQQLGSLLDTLEEAVVLVTVSQSSLLVRMVTQHLLTVGPLDVVGASAPAVLAQTQDSVVVLALLNG